MKKLIIATMILFLSSVVCAQNYYDFSITGGGSWPLVDLEIEHHVDGKRVYKKFETTLPYQTSDLKADYLRIAVVYKDRNSRNHTSSWTINVLANGNIVHRESKKGMWTQSIMAHGTPSRY